MLFGEYKIEQRNPWLLMTVLCHCWGHTVLLKRRWNVSVSEIYIIWPNFYVWNFTDFHTHSFFSCHQSHSLQESDLAFGACVAADISRCPSPHPSPSNLHAKMFSLSPSHPLSLCTSNPNLGPIGNELTVLFLTC